MSSTEDVGQTCHRGCGTDVSQRMWNRGVEYRGHGIDVSRTGREQTCHRGYGIDVSSTEDVGHTCHRGCGTDVSQRMWNRRVTEDVEQTCRVQRMRNRRVEYRGYGIDVSSTEDVGQTCRAQSMWDRRVEYR